MTGVQTCALPIYKIWGMRQGAFDYMVKPIDHTTLLEKIRALG